jgi:hypothetical protein
LQWLGFGAAAFGLFYRDQTLGLRSVGRRHPGGLRREADVYLEYPRARLDANSFQTPAVGLLLGANDKIDFSKGNANAQPGSLWELWRICGKRALPS